MKNICVLLMVLTVFTGVATAQNVPSQGGKPVLAKRIVLVHDVSADVSTKITTKELRLLTEVLKTELSANSIFLVAEGEDTPDAEISVSLSESGSHVTTAAQFVDLRRPANNFSRRYQGTSLEPSVWVTKTLTNFVSDLQPLVQPFAQTVTVQETNRVENRVEVETIVKSLTVKLSGQKGETLSFADGTTQEFGETGTIILADRAQKSGIVFLAHMPGYYSRDVTIDLIDKDIDFDAHLEKIPVISLGLGVSYSGDLPGLMCMYGIVPEHLFLRFGLGNNLVEAGSSHTNTYDSVGTTSGGKTSPLPFALFIQPTIGALYYFTDPRSLFQLGAQLDLSSRFDNAEGQLQLSQRVAFEGDLQAVLDLRFVRFLSVFVSAGARLFFSQSDLAQIIANENSLSYYGFDLQAAKNGDDDRSGTVHLAPNFQVGVRFWL